MGSDARATICFGIALEEDGEYPWDNDFEDWWIDTVCQYVPPFQLYNEEGQYLNGKKPENAKMDEYYEHLFKFKKEHPLPVEMAWYGSGDDSVMILAVKETIQSTEWDAPKEISPFTLTVKEENLNQFKEFCKTHLNIEAEPTWLLSAYYG